MEESVGKADMEIGHDGTVQIPLRFGAFEIRKNPGPKRRAGDWDCFRGMIGHIYVFVLSNHCVSVQRDDMVFSIKLRSRNIITGRTRYLIYGADSSMRRMS